MNFLIALIMVLMSVLPVHAGSISRPAKSFGGISFINNVVPQASDFNGDIDTVYAEFNGNIANVNISASAAIGPTKINPDGFTTNIRTVNAAPCNILDESDQAADSKRWYWCITGGEFRVSTYTDAGSVQNDWLKINRANGGTTLGGTSGTNTINGATTFNQFVTFTGGTTFAPSGTVQMFMGTSAPTGWTLMDGSTLSCTGASAVNAGLCVQLVGLYGTVNYKGAAASTVTFDTATDEVIHTAHGHATGDRVHFTTTNTLPTLASGTFLSTTVYCIISTTTDRYKISATCGGASLDYTTVGSGTHSDYFNFVVPDGQGRTMVGAGTGTLSETITSQTASGNAVPVTTNNTKWITGQQVTVSNASGFTGLTNGTWWIVRNNSTSVKFATSLANAQNGTVATVTGTGSATLTASLTARTLGEIGGEEAHATAIAELLSHNHTISNAMPASGTTFQGSGTGSGGAGSVTIGNTGGNAAANIMNPFLVMTYIIKL